MFEVNIYCRYCSGPIAYAKIGGWYHLESLDQRNCLDCEPESIEDFTGGAGRGSV